jgi:hypothetical protein
LNKGKFLNRLGLEAFISVKTVLVVSLYTKQWKLQESIAKDDRMRTREKVDAAIDKKKKFSTEGFA